MTESIKNHAFKIQVITAVTVVLAIIGTTNYFVTRLERIEACNREIKANIIVIEEQLTSNKEHIDSLEEKSNQAGLDRMKILTKLESIEVSVIEIKNNMD